MSEDTTSTNSSSKPDKPETGAQSTIGVPIAIVMAGAIIAAAIFYGGGGSGGDKGDVVAEVVPVEVAPDGPAVPTVGEVRPVSEIDHIRGAANAKVTIIEYSDLECPFCKRFHPILQQVMDEYPNDVRWVYRHFPLEQLHSKAKQEAVATECAGEQGKFWELTDLIYKVTPGNDGLDLESLPDMAKQVGVANAAQFASCLESGKYDDHIEADLADAAAAGGRGTPYSVIIGEDGEMYPLSGAQPYAAVKAAIDSLL